MINIIPSYKKPIIINESETIRKAAYDILKDQNKRNIQNKKSDIKQDISNLSNVGRRALNKVLHKKENYKLTGNEVFQARNTSNNIKSGIRNSMIKGAEYLQQNVGDIGAGQFDLSDIAIDFTKYIAEFAIGWKKEKMK